MATLTAEEEGAARRRRRRRGWIELAVITAILVLIAFPLSLVGYQAAWHRAPWSAVPDRYQACGTWYWETKLSAEQWSHQVSSRPLPGGPDAPLRLVGQTGGWVNTRPIYAYVHSGTHRYQGCGILTFLKVGDGQLMVYGTDEVDYTIVG